MKEPGCIMRLRDFLAPCAAGSLLASTGDAAPPLVVKFRREPSYRALAAFVDPGLDEFPGEKIAIEIESRLHTALMSGDLPIAATCSGASPMPREYRAIASDVSTAVYGDSGDIAAGWKTWRDSLRAIELARFYSDRKSVVEGKSVD